MDKNTILNEYQYIQKTLKIFKTNTIATATCKTTLLTQLVCFHFYKNPRLFYINNYILDYLVFSNLVQKRYNQTKYFINCNGYFYGSIIYTYKITKKGSLIFQSDLSNEEIIFILKNNITIFEWLCFPFLTQEYHLRNDNIPYRKKRKTLLNKIRNIFYK